MGLEQLKKSLDEKMHSSYKLHSHTVKQNKKPLMERFRRRKINNYLEELKYLVLSALNKEVSLYNKMEKADILDMAVKYIKATRLNSEVSTTDGRQGHDQSPNISQNYRTCLQPQSKNIIHDNLSKSYDNSCQAKELVSEAHREKENYFSFQNDKNTKEKILQRNKSVHQREENNIRERISKDNIRNNEISNTTTTSIWRPW